jgi:RNAse (barnase) inhibitor barstar
VQNPQRAIGFWLGLWVTGWLMAVFQKEAEQMHQLDWALLQNGAITLYRDPQLLEEDVEWLRGHHYRVDSFDCSAWYSESEMHEAFSSRLVFPEYYGRNIHALNDCISDIEVQLEAGRVLVLNRYDYFAAKFPDVAWSVLDVMEINSRRLLLFGLRLIILVQSDDPEISFDPVGGRPVMWNTREWLNKARGL